MLLKSEKTAVIEANRTHESDTGSPGFKLRFSQKVWLTEHLKVHRKTTTHVGFAKNVWS